MYTSKKYLDFTKEILKNDPLLEEISPKRGLIRIGVRQKALLFSFLDLNKGF